MPPIGACEARPSLESGVMSNKLMARSTVGTAEMRSSWYRTRKHVVETPIKSTNSSGNAGCTVDGAGATQECSCTVPRPYWSASTFSGEPLEAWFQDFLDFSLNVDVKSDNRYVRAVRGGL